MNAQTQRYVRISVMFLTLILLSEAARSQYYGERVLQKGFEQTDFFFKPTNVIPYGLGQFAGTTPGVLRDPLLDLVLSPAHLRLDSTYGDMMLYTDFRAARNVKDEPEFVYPWYRTMGVADRAFAPYYPTIYVQNRRELEPVFSGAYIGRPLPESAPELFFGATYQLVMQDQKYYNVPQDIYHSVIGADYAGRATAEDKSNMPIVDRYSGQDNMHQNGHFISLFAKQRFLGSLDAGIKVSRVLFDRNGGFGSSNLWDSYYGSSSSVSLWANDELRAQGYNHWEVAGGLLLALSEKTSIGLSGGHLWGTATQALTNLDTSYYSYAYANSASYSNRSANKYQDWRNDGKTTQFGLELRSRLSASTTLTLFYRPQWSSVQLHTAASVQDTNYGYYSWVNDTTPVSHYSHYRFSDIRAGGGEEKTSTNLFLATLNWDLDPRVTLSLGAQLELNDVETRTVENVEAHGRSANWYDNPANPYSWFNQEDEVKSLQWTFTAKRQSFRIPIFVNIKASQAAGILLGICRDMSKWEIEDVTLATFRRRYRDNNGTVEDRSNFGERYTQPKEEVSDIKTTFMAGLTLSPSPVFQARVLVVPVFAERFDGQELEQLQWWFGLTVTP
jgi:hypothetical protein